MPAPDLEALRRAVHGPILTDPEVVAALGRDGSHLAGHPWAAVRPQDADDVERLVRWARATRTPLVARGGGTSLDGESTAFAGSVVVDFSGWNRVLEVRADELWARVEPGVVNWDLQTALRPTGRFFPPNPGSWRSSTVGGNAATNASGPRSFRYGPTRAWVREVRAVVGTGATVRLGSKAAKRSVGPDLLGLYVGSEGTLGLTTEVTVRLAPLPPVRRGLVVGVPAGASLGGLAARLAGRAETGLSAVEYLDAPSAAVLAERRGELGPAPGPILLLEVEAEDDADADLRRRRVESLLRAAGVPGAPVEFPNADELWRLRGESSVVLDEQFGQRIREDVAVPLGRVDAFLTELRRITADERVPLYLFGHLGEGSLHPNLVVDPSSPVAARLREAILRAALAHDGTISGEHGIGRLKSGMLAQELGAEGIRLLRSVKSAFDPDGILNPGKVLPNPAT